jgi:hypothetical protein
MKRKNIISVLFLAGAFIATNPGGALSQSVGGSQSERSGSGDQTPMPKGRSTGDETKAGKGAAGKTQSQTNKDTSVGGSQSDRSGSGDQTPMPKSRSTGDETKPSKGGTGKANP